MAASKILAAVIDKRTPLDGMLDQGHGNPAYRALSDADRSLCRAILNATLRHLPRIEAALAAMLDTPLPAAERRQRVEKVLFAATKADLLHHTSHDRLENILKLIVEQAMTRAEYSGASIDVAALAAIRAGLAVGQSTSNLTQ